MQQIIASFLLSKKYCPLPGVGSLQMLQQSASYLPGENKITGPKTSIQLVHEIFPVKDLIEFIAFKKQISSWQADTELEDFCKEIKNLSGSKEIELPHAGKFYTDAEGYLCFREQPLFTEFFPPVEAHRVIHPNEPHQMLVGDKETTNQLMSEFLSSGDAKGATRWWIPCLVFLLIAAATIVYYYSQPHPKNVGGNAHKTEVKTMPNTYRVSQ